MGLFGNKRSKLALTVKGIKCEHCAEKVKAACRKCTGVDGVDVNVATGRVIVTGTGYSVTDVVSAVKNAGYEVASFAECKLDK